MRRRKQRTEIWLGVLVIVTSGLLIWGYFWLTGQPLGEPGYSVVVTLPDAGGLESGDRVRVSGVEVGSVRSVRLTPEGRVVATLHLSHDLRVPGDSRALLQSAGVFGERYIEIRLGSSDADLASGDTLAAATASSLTDLAGDLGRQAETVLGRVEQLLADTTIGQMQGSVASLEATITELQRLVSAHGDEFARMSESLSRTAQELERAVDGEQVERTVADMQKTSATLAETAESLRVSARSLASISEKIDRGQGTLGRLVNDHALYEELQSTVRSIGALTRDIQENPGRYLKFAVF